MMNIAAIIQARMGSTRLPGKVLKSLAGKSVLSHVVERIRAVPAINSVTVATTTSSIDDAIIEEANAIGVTHYRGSEHDVLTRYYEAALESRADVVVRITADCPLLDPTVVDNVIDHFFRENADYGSNTLERSFPRGLDTEVFTMQALSDAYKHASRPEQREHVTPYLYQNSEKFKLASIKANEDFSYYRWTLDTEEDWALINEIYRHLYYSGKIFTWQEAIALMKRIPELAQINEHIEQKKLGE